MASSSDLRCIGTGTGHQGFIHWVASSCPMLICMCVHHRDIGTEAQGEKIVSFKAEDQTEQKVAWC